MGDSRRFFVLREMIEKQFPRAKKIANIACGANIQPGWDNFDLRINKAHHSSIMRFSGGQYDLVIGLHPDSATWDTIRLAKESVCPFVVIPCCHIPSRGGPSPSRNCVWENWLETQAVQMGFVTRRYLMRFAGKNVAIVGTPKGK